MRVYKNTIITFFIALIAIMLVTPQVKAHATIVLGRLNSEPTTPLVNESFTLTLEMLDPSQVAVEDAIVFAEFNLRGDTTQLEFTQTETPGIYQTQGVLASSGEYQLIMRDQTFRQEEARANLSFFVTTQSDSQTNEASIAFVFPPTATGSNNITTWLIWLIGIPILAGIVVTVVVLLNPRKDVEEA